jgi:AraC-like DNA-binding protein
LSDGQAAIASRLLDDLLNYLKHLKREYGYKITLHQIERVSGQSWYQLLPYNYHQCAVCCEIKSSSTCWKRCVDRQYKVRAKAEIAPYIGTCFAGVTEAVFPIWDIHDMCNGFLCVSGYTADRAMSMERACAAAAKYGLPRDRLRAAVEKLNDDIPELGMLSERIAPVQTMLRMLLYFNNIAESSRVFSSPREKLYHEILNYTNSEFRNPDFSLRNICGKFNISYSYASHLFAEFNDASFVTYVRNIRIEAAKRYLEHTTLPIIFTSSECGFSDSNYFSSVFRKETGMSPSEYREQYAHVENGMSLKLKCQLMQDESEKGGKGDAPQS